MKKNISAKQVPVHINHVSENKADRLVKSIESITVHDHLCLIYENTSEQFAAVIPFIRIGLERGEKCVYIIDENIVEEVFEAMRADGVDVNSALKKGSLVVETKKEAYLRNGYFDPDEMIRFLKESTIQAKKEGYSALRVTGEMTWMLGEEPGSDRLIEYEAKLNRFLPTYDCLALCQYHRTRFAPEILLDVIHTHPTVVVGNTVCKNFYYVPVEEFLKKGKETTEEVDRLLNNLIDRERVEEERVNNLNFLKHLDLMNRAIQGTNDLEQMMRDVLDAALTIFDCDRAWLVYPSDPMTPTYGVPMERTKPEFPGAHLRGANIPVDAATQQVLLALSTSDVPLVFDRDSKPPLPSFLEKEFDVQSQIAIEIHPKIGKFYVFGLHQCTYKRVWTAEEKRLLQEIGRRLADGLTSLLLYRDLQISEGKFRNVIETASEGIWILNEEHKTTFVNQRLLEMMGYTEKEMIGKKLGDFVFSAELADHEKRMQERKAGKTDSYERRFLCKDGEVIWTHISATPLFDEKKQVVGAFGMLMDITKHKQAEKELIQVNRALRMVSDINQTLVRATDETSLLNDTCRIATEEGGYPLAWVGFVEQDQQKTVRPVAQAGSGKEYAQSAHITWADEKNGRGPTGTAIRTGKTQVVRDISKDVNMSPWRQIAQKYHFQSSIAIPLISDGKTFGSFNIYSTTGDAFYPAEIKILEELAGDLAFGIMSQRMRAEHRDTEEKFVTAFKVSPDLMSITRLRDGTILEVNDGYTQLLGYERSESVGKTMAELSIWMDYNDRAKFVSLLEKNGEVNDFETMLRRKDGTSFSCIDSAKTFQFKGETCVLSIVHDMTERHKNEKELARLNRTLFMLSDINQSLIKITNEQELLEKVCQIIVEKGGYRLMWIGFAEQDQAKTVRPVAQAGFGTDYLKFTKITWADDEHGRGPTGISIRTGKTQVVHDILKDPKMTPWRQAATERGYKASIALPLSSEGNTFGALNIYSSEEEAFGEKEIAVLEELAGDLAFGIATMRLRKKTEERTREVDQLKNNFIQIVSHQLRTPLTVVRWNLSVILERQRGEVVPAQEEALRGALDANAEIIARVGDLLSAIDIEEGRVRLQTETANIVDLFESICEEKLRPCHLKKITYEIFPPKEPLPEIQIDAIKIRDVIVRLIDNAITYTNNGGHIVVKLFEKENKIRFEISDTGVGIPITEQKHLFERFHRGWNAALMKPDASGLSLFISKHFINIHKGTIGFTSVEKKGSTFWFELPIV